ncbi:MAG: metal ABC transporter permease [Sphaerochaetaceae bacterium]|nr:metal ABC transporter permease [Sphaerochaetaceae bacterium]
MLSLLLLPPMLKALVAIFVGGLAFPACGVMVLRLDLVPLRYALMHGVILGGAIALAFEIPSLPMIIIVNMLVVVMVLKLQSNNSISSAAAMVFTMGLASLIMHIYDVPAKDSLQLLWGSPFALTYLDLTVLVVLCIILFVYIASSFKNIVAIFFDNEIAGSLGINVKFHYSFMVVIIALTVALAMRLIGALLIDALLILPVLIASKYSKGTKELFIKSSLTGVFLSVLGYFLSLCFNYPLSATIALSAALMYLILTLIQKIKINKRYKNEKETFIAD